MDTFDKDKDIEHLLHRAKLELPQSRKASIRQSLRESKRVTTSSSRETSGLFRKRLGAGLAIVPAVLLVGLFAFALRSHWLPMSQSAGGHSQSNNTSSLIPNTPPYDYHPLLGFEPMLPSESFQLAQITSDVFKYVNPPWGNNNANVTETWGNNTAYDAMYIALNGQGKSFTIMETSTNASSPPDTGTPWKTLRNDGMVFYQNTIPGSGTVVATIKNGVLCVVMRASDFSTTQLEQILQSLSIPVNKAPEMIETQTFGFSQAPQAVPFKAFLPKSLPFRSSTSLATGVYVKTYGSKDNSAGGRLTLTYERGKTQLKIIEGLGMKYVNPNLAGAQNGVKVTLKDRETAVYIDGGEGIAMIDGGSTNRRAITWTAKAGVNIVIVASQDLSKNDLLVVANSLEKVQ